VNPEKSRHARDFIYKNLKQRAFSAPSGQQDFAEVCEGRSRSEDIVCITKSRPGLSETLLFQCDIPLLVGGVKGLRCGG
jgi:hypothetical protein